MPSQTTIVIDYNEGITLEQFHRIEAYVGAQMSQFAHLIRNVSINSVAPVSIEVPLTVTVMGLPEETAIQEILAKVTAALLNQNGVQYKVQVAGAKEALDDESAVPATPLVPSPKQ